MNTSQHAVPLPPRTLRLRGSEIRRDAHILARFVQMYCRAHHHGAETLPVPARGFLAPWLKHMDIGLCPECRDLFLHGAAKRVQCPFDTKPRCKNCPTPCYRPGYRETMRTVMRYSGLRMILHGRLDLILKYLF